ncbi:MAG: hypothetical protein R3335_12785 [Anaerolineales bacterium]|nr:hypothetical protein [Anaerolineales bacterium]
MTDSRGWRWLLLGLLLVALVGPWAYDVVHVPARYACSAPFTRLEGDFCGIPLSGFSIARMMAGSVLYSLTNLFSGDTGLARELLFGLGGIVLVLPLILSFYLILREGTRRIRYSLMIVLGLAIGLGLLVGTSTLSGPIFGVWGVWLYTITAACALVLEGITLVRPKILPAAG